MLAVSCGEGQKEDCKEVELNKDVNVESHLNCSPKPCPDPNSCTSETKSDESDVCNMYIANSVLGDRADRATIFSAMVGISYCQIKNVFHAGDLGRDHEAFWEDLSPNLKQVGFYPARGDHDYPWRETADFLKSKMPYLGDKLSACKNYYVVETDSSWATVVLDTNDECSWSWDAQIQFLQSVASHGYERLEVVAHHSPYSSIGNAETREDIHIQDILTSSYQPAPQNIVVFSGTAPGYSRDKIGPVEYVTAGSAGPKRGTCKHSASTESCYPDSSFVLCTKSSCKAFNRFGSKVDEF